MESDPQGKCLVAPALKWSVILFLVVLLGLPLLRQLAQLILVGDCFL